MITTSRKLCLFITLGGILGVISSCIKGDNITPDENSCCQQEVCKIPCSTSLDKPSKGFGIVVMLAIMVFVIVGFATVYFVKNKAENFFVAGRSLPLWVVCLTLASQSLDSNALLGNVDLSYKFHFYDGAVLPIGLGLSLILNGIFFASKINQDNALTLPDVFAKRYGRVVEILASFCTIISFLFLLAGNLVGMGVILGYLLDISQDGAIWMSAVLVLLYTIAGGLFSVAYTDVVQAAIGWIGSLTIAFYFIKNAKHSAPPPSIGFDGYIYPDEATAKLYDGIPCANDASLFCYNTQKWCPSDDNCVADNGAYPFGDKPIFNNQMTDAHSLTPFPNAIMFNWATIFVLAFGNLAALDFQARCMASKTPRAATLGCLIAGALTFLVGIPYSYLGAITRVYYGPDSLYAEFDADTCSPILGLPTCAMWKPDALAYIKLLTHEAPSFLGAWALIGIVAASMSTCDGAILAMGTVFSHNVIRNLNSFFPAIKKDFVTDHNLLTVARLVAIPFTAISALIATFHNKTGYLLIVAFDVVLASVVVPLFGCFYTKKPSTLAALCAILTGATVRVVLEFALSKDGFLLLPFSGDEFLDYGPAATTAKDPIFIDSASQWDSTVDTCEQKRFSDYTGVDSLAAPLCALIVFVTIQFLERNGPLIEFKSENMVGYEKTQVGEDGEIEDISKATVAVDVSQKSTKAKVEAEAEAEIPVQTD